jgi:CheY-like chemotaxis protein
MERYLNNENLKFSVILISASELKRVEIEDLHGIPVILIEKEQDSSNSNSNIYENVVDVLYSPIEKSRLYAVLAELVSNKKRSNTDLVKSKLRILIVDDNRQNTNLIKGLLEQLGYTNVSMMPNGFEIMDKLKTGVATIDYDLILMDFYLPKWTGDQLTVAIKKKVKGIYIVGMTASTNVDIKKKAFQAGMDAFLWKPLDAKELETLLEIVVKKKGYVTSRQ